MIETDPLAYNRLLVAYRAAREAPVELDGDVFTRSRQRAHLQDLERQARSGPLSLTARSTVDLALDAMGNRSLLMRIGLTDLDDALEHIDVVRAAELQPDPSCKTLSQTVAWYSTGPGRFRQHHPDAKAARELHHARTILEMVRNRELAHRARSQRSALREYLGSAGAERTIAQVRMKLVRGHVAGFKRYMAEDRINSVEHFRLMLAQNFLHALHYGTTPETLLHEFGSDRVGGIAKRARTNLAEYRDARLAAGLRAMPRAAQRFLASPNDELVSAR